jgi:hypothetical protein
LILAAIPPKLPVTQGREHGMQDSRDMGLEVADTAADDARAFNKGKGKTLAGMLACLVAALAAFGWYLVSEQPNPYGELGKQVNGMRGQYFDAFLTCALPGKMIGELKNATELRDELVARAASGARYGAHLRKCAAPLKDLSIQLRALLPPDDAAPLVKKLADASTKLSVGTDAFALHLEGLEGAYDTVRAGAESQEIVRGWFEFRTALGGLNTLIKEKLGR